MSVRWPLLVLTTLAVAQPEGPLVVLEPVITDDPATLEQLEARGFSFDSIVGRTHLADLKKTLGRDMAEFTAGQSRESPRRAFDLGWLDRGHFELVGVVQRLDRQPFDDLGAQGSSAGCGEVRLIYRLALAPRGRPSTRLPMTVNVRLPQPRLRGDESCRDVARRWLTAPDAARVLRALPPPRKIEVNLQSIHVPSYRQDMDDNAEYLLRTFRVEGSRLEEELLLNTPRTDLDAAERQDLAHWIEQNLGAIDRGEHSLPARFLARRAVSVSPRGLVRIENHPFSRLFGDGHAHFENLPLGTMQQVRTTELLVRRLDEGTCTGCHQSRGVAGFHLLGSERDPDRAFNALAVGRSPHLANDLAWRARTLHAQARGEPTSPRPFAAHPDGRFGAPCGRSRGFAGWGCGPGLVCRDVHGRELGACAPPTGGTPGAFCEDAEFEPNARPEGYLMKARAPDSTCPAPSGAQREGAFCAPNWLGFTGGMCSERCGEIGRGGPGWICAPLPAAGYESDCFLSEEVVEACLARHSVRARISTCSEALPCRDDYACARVDGAPPGEGACVPPYFVFQVRVDGPRLDR